MSCSSPQHSLIASNGRSELADGNLPGVPQKRVQTYSCDALPLGVGIRKSKRASQLGRETEDLAGPNRKLKTTAYFRNIVLIILS